MSDYFFSLESALWWAAEDRADILDVLYELREEENQ